MRVCNALPQNYIKTDITKFGFKANLPNRQVRLSIKKIMQKL